MYIYICIYIYIYIILLNHLGVFKFPTLSFFENFYWTSFYVYLKNKTFSFTFLFNLDRPMFHILDIT